MDEPTPSEVAIQQQVAEAEEMAWQAWLLRFNEDVRRGMEDIRVASISNPQLADQMNPRSVMQTVMLQRLFRLERDFREMVNVLSEAETGEKVSPPIERKM